MKILKSILYKTRSVCKLNWYATLKINFKKFKFKDAIRFPVIVYGKLRIVDLSGEIFFNCPIKRGIIKIGTEVEVIVTSYGTAQLTLAGKLIVNGPFTTGKDVSIVIERNGVLNIGEGTYLGNHTKLIVVNDVYFGKWIRFAYDSQLLSTNFHNIKNMITGMVNKMSGKGIVVNDYCWIGNNSTIMQGSILPEKSIITSHSLVNKDFSKAPQYPMIGGIPAKVIGYGKCRVFNPEVDKWISDYFTEHPDVIEYDASNLDIF